MERICLILDLLSNTGLAGVSKATWHVTLRFYLIPSGKLMKLWTKSIKNRIISVVYKQYIYETGLYSLAGFALLISCFSLCPVIISMCPALKSQLKQLHLFLYLVCVFGCTVGRECMWGQLVGVSSLFPPWGIKLRWSISTAGLIVTWAISPAPTILNFIILKHLNMCKSYWKVS